MSDEKTALNPVVIARRQAVESEMRQRMRRLRLSARIEPGDWQEPHDPTVSVVVRIAGTRTRQQGRRRKVDARLWDAMTAEQEAAAQCVADAFRLIVGGMHRTMAFEERIRRGPELESAANGYRDRLVASYFSWGRYCQAKGISATAALDVIVYGESARAVDRDRRKRKGWGRDNLFLALDLYAVANPKLVGRRAA